MTEEPTVLIIGAGPVGLTLAIDLARRGVAVTVVEERHRGAAPEPKCNHVAARSMEIFRRLGVASQIRHAGLPPDYPHDISYRTTFVGRELTRISIPCRSERFTRTEGPDCGWPTPEPPHRINQVFLEPILFRHAEAQPRVRILHRTRAEPVSIDETSATVKLVDLDDGRERTVRTRFLVGCDGARSVVRRAMGASYHGDAVIQSVQSTCIRAPSLVGLQKHERAWGTGSVNARRAGMVYAIDGRELWLVHNYLRQGEGDFDAVDRDACIRSILGVGKDFEYQIVSKEDWVGRRLVADRVRRGAAFIAGDAAHIWVPYAGYGMNAGIADAAGLAWLLAAHINGWAPLSILDAYEAERLPITEQVSHFAMRHAEQEIKRRGAIPAELEDDGPAGDDARRRVGVLTYEINVQQYACAGLNFGPYYEKSPIIAYDGATPPAYTMAHYTSSTVPGCRLPHVFLADGVSLYDRLGPDYTLLRLDLEADIQPLVIAAEARRVPLKVLDLPRASVGPDYRSALLIVRPDQHIAWRGDRLPEDAGNLLDRLCGCHRH